MGIFSAIKYVSILIVVVMVAGGLYYAMNLKAALAISEENSKKLEMAVQTQQAVIAQQKADMSKIREINDQLNEANTKLQKDVDNLNNKFDINAKGQSRDFGAITRAKPALINKIINGATKKVNRCFEIATGSPIKEGEKNSECQELINSFSK